jgi:glycosyltransferase involved in cell wall biosynthesis
MPVSSAAQKLPLSLVVITLNEASNLPRCLKSVPFADEILVVDSFSQDRTLEVAQEFGARVLSEAWRGFGAQKRWATEQAKNNWVLSLDADECLSPELANYLQQNFGKLNPSVGYKIPRLSFYLGKWIRHGGWFPDYQLRLFHRSSAQWSVDPIHEKVISAQTEKLDFPLHHFVFRDMNHQIATNNRYSSLQAEQALKGGQSFSLLRILVKPWSKFFECYFWKRGFLDGFPGFFIAVGAAYSVFLRYGKIWELQNQKKDKTSK